MSREPFPALGRPAPGELVDARLQIHWAAQPVSAVGRTWLPHRDDDGHTNFGWSAELEALVGREVEVGGQPLAAALAPARLEILLLDGRERVVDRLALGGRTLDDAYAFLARSIAERGGQERPLDRPDYEMPSHPVAEGGAFAVDLAAASEVSRWFTHAQAVAVPAALALLDAAEIRVWPHHFDLGALAFFAANGAEEIPQVGFGLSPGDESIPEPYWYVTAYPVPDAATRPPLPEGGSWEEEAFSGALLLGSTVVAAGLGPQQHARSATFLRAAIQACRGLVGRLGEPR